MNARPAGGLEAPRRTPDRPAIDLAQLVIGAVRPAAEFGMLMADPVFWGWLVPRGDHLPVLTLPGLFAGDNSLQPLRDWLARTGYRPIRSGLERNPGWSEDLVQSLGEIAEEAHRYSGRRITIIGHSMGGLLGRSIAVRRPHAVGHVISLGAPLAMRRERLPAAVRATAIYSREDRIVRPQYARDSAPHADNIEVSGSHIGLAVNPAVYHVLARVLPAAPTNAERMTTRVR